MCQLDLNKHCIFSLDYFLVFKNFTIVTFWELKLEIGVTSMIVVRKIVDHWQCYLLCIFNLPLSSLSALSRCFAQCQSQLFTRDMAKISFFLNIWVVFHSGVWKLRVSTLEFSNVVTAALALNSPDSFEIRHAASLRNSHAGIIWSSQGSFIPSTAANSKLLNSTES